MKRILIYFGVILLIAVAYLIVRGSDGVTGRNVAVATCAALLFAALIWLRWDLAPKIARRKRAQLDDRRSKLDAE